jgi:hypothetical protein
MTAAKSKFLLVVFDGLRRELITPERMPNLDRFRRQGVDCPESRSAMPSETRVQVSSFVSGCYAGGHGIMGNSFYDPVLGLKGPMDTSDLVTMQIAEKMYPDGVFAADDLGGLLHHAGLKLVTASTGKIGNARLLNYNAAQRDQVAYSIHGAGVSSPAANHAEIEAQFGPVPSSDLPHVGLSDYLTTLILEHFLPRHNPDVLIAWYSEPDMSYHYRGIGSAEADAAMSGVDEAFGRLLDWWESEGKADGWQIIAASDHAHITVTGCFDIAEEMQAAGFKVGSAIGPDVDVAVTTGYAGTVFVRERQADLVDSVLTWMQEQPHLGMLLARDGHGLESGAFDLASIGMTGPRAPDIFYIGRTSDEMDMHGLYGSCLNGNSSLPIGGSTHGGLHPKELNNFLSFGGDRFQSGQRYTGACGVVDVAPTILDGLGIKAPYSMHGRSLMSALTCGAVEQAEKRWEIGRGQYQQELSITTVPGGHMYINGGQRLQ